MILNTVKNEIECATANIVYLTSYFTECYTLYRVEADKSSKDYDKKKADRFFERATSYAQRSIEYAESIGLDPKSVCKDCVNFMESYRIIIKKDVA